MCTRIPWIDQYHGTMVEYVHVSVLLLLASRFEIKLYVHTYTYVRTLPLVVNSTNGTIPGKPIPARYCHTQWYQVHTICDAKVATHITAIVRPRTPPLKVI
jgi:hypothetical protein